MQVATMCPRCGCISSYYDKKSERLDICQYCNIKRIEIDVDGEVLYNMSDDEFSIAGKEINQQFLFHLPTFDETAYEDRLREEAEDEIRWQKMYDEVKQKEQDRNNPKCPNCKSTAVTAGQRGFSIITGFWGSGNTVNRCASCGHKWKP